MKCAACHHEMARKRGEIDLRIGGKLYLVRNVFYEECTSCGEKVLSPEISEILFEKIKNKEFVEQMINVPVLDGTYG
ncbi:MAG: YgiT-type zinc finger protein [Proteobacteria bacterium]|nr:YgiT-type zinc finger protein [Pseudomonadota bacterium]